MTSFFNRANIHFFIFQQLQFSHFSNLHNGLFEVRENPPPSFQDELHSKLFEIRELYVMCQSSILPEGILSVSFESASCCELR